MKIDKLVLITDAVENLSYLTGTDVEIILEQLEDHCFSAEDAFKIQECFMNERIFEDVQ